MSAHTADGLILEALFLEVHPTRIDVRRADDLPPTGISGDTQPEISVYTSPGRHESMALCRVVTSIHGLHPLGEYVVSVQGTYGVNGWEEDDLTPEILANFLMRRAMNELVPYLRSELEQATFRVFRKVVSIPVMTGVELQATEVFDVSPSSPDAEVGTSPEE